MKTIEQLKQQGPKWGVVAIVAWVCALGMCGGVFGAAAPVPASYKTNAFHTLNLAEYSNQIPEGAGTRQTRLIPQGVQVYHGVPFSTGERVLLTGMQSARAGEYFPNQILGIPIGRKAARVHLLHGALYSAKDGTPMAKIVFHYANGAEESFRLGYGVHARNIARARLEKRSGLSDPNSQSIWPDNDVEHSGTRVYQTALANLHPEETILSIDLVSLFSLATPFVLGITVEDGESGLRPNWKEPLRKTYKEMQEAPDSAYRQNFVISVVNAANNSPVTNAVAGLTITDDEQTFFFGEATADGTGICRLPFPPEQMLSYSILVRGSNFLPKVLPETESVRSSTNREFRVALEHGVRIGGLVKTKDGQPVAGAEVLIHKVTKTGLRDYLRVDHDKAITDATGKWSSSSVPPIFEGFSFQVSHTDFRPVLYTMPGFAEPPPVGPNVNSGNSLNTIRRVENGRLVEEEITTLQVPPGVNIRRNGARSRFNQPQIPMLSSNDLAQGTAVITLEPAFMLIGTVLDATGKPVSNADLVFQRRTPAYERKHAQTDGQGRFKIPTAEPGDAALIVVRDGFTPKYCPVNIEAGMTPIEVRLVPLRVLKGRVVDQKQMPVSGARVKLEDWMGAGDLLRFETMSDNEGRFAWTGAPPDQLVFYVTKSNYYSMRTSMSGDAEELTLNISRPPGFYGKVIDAETKKPIEYFSIIRGRKYNPDEPDIHWERYDTGHGANGEYSLRMENYYFQPEARIKIEAPGYMPQISEGYRIADTYVIDFALKKGQGISGLALLPDGTPAANATLVLVETNEYAYMDAPGQFRANSSYGDFTRTDSQGHFEFSPKLEAQTIFATHELGFAEASAADLSKSHKIVLQNWGTIKGVMKVGDTNDPEHWVRLQSQSSGYSVAALNLYIKGEADENGNFQFEKVPTGFARVAVEYKLRESSNGETPLSHGVSVEVKPGKTTEVTLGGNGRKVTGFVKVIGGDQSDVDWRRDVHKLTFVLPSPTNTPVFAPVTGGPEEQRKAMADYNRRMREYWKSPEGLAHLRAERSYVLLFDTNGAFHANNVLPGKYFLTITANDPEQENYNQRQIGIINTNIIVPEQLGAKVNQPFDLGTLELKIQSRMRLGRAAPNFEGKTLDGQKFSLTEHVGKPVLLYFWATNPGFSSYDLQMLNELYKSYATQDKLFVVGLNLDADPKPVKDLLESKKIQWPQVMLGEWSQTSVPAMYGVDGYPVGLLVDASGKLASKQLRGSMLRTAVRNLIANGGTGGMDQERELIREQF